MVVEPTPVTNELLDEMSGQGDPVADDVIARQFEWMRSQSGGMAVDEPSDLVRRMAAHMRLPRGPVVSPYEEYLARDDARLPDWATDDDADHLERRAVSFFECHALHIGSALFCGSLPAAYASPRGARVLVLTGRLGDDFVRRVSETAQFLVDTMACGGLERARPGYEDIQRVRTMHAAIRNFIQHDPKVPRSRFHPPPPNGWCDAWGVPINQEDLLGALFTFTVTVFEVLEKLGVECDPADLDAYMFRWCVIGHLMGIRPDILPIDRATAAEVAELIRARQCERSADGQYLTGRLVGSIQHTVSKRHATGLVPATVRWYVGDEVADLLAVHRNGWTRVLKGPVARISDAASPDPTRLSRFAAGRGAVATKAYDSMTKRLGGAALEGFLEANRPGEDRPPFCLPSELRTQIPRPLLAFRLRRPR